MKKLLVLFTITAIFTGCGKNQGLQGASGPAGPQGATATVNTPIETAIQVMVDTQNAYRNSIGQESLMPGLTCTLYTVPTTTTAIIGATLTNIGSFGFTGVFNQVNESVSNGLNILPTALENVYQSWYIVKCTGSFVVTDSNYHQFTLSSDDGSNLYVDGLLINNDGLHGVQAVSNTKYLIYGFHSFELDFLQASGNEALILNYDGLLLDNTHFYH